MGVAKLLSRWIQEGKPQILRRPHQLLQRIQTVYTQSWKVFSRKYYYPSRLGHSQIPRSFCGARYLCHMQLGRKSRTYSCAKKQVAQTRCDVRTDLNVFFACDSSAHQPAAVCCVPGAIFQRAGKSLRLRLRWASNCGHVWAIPWVQESEKQLRKNSGVQKYWIATYHETFPASHWCAAHPDGAAQHS